MAEHPQKPYGDALIRSIKPKRTPRKGSDLRVRVTEATKAIRKLRAYRLVEERVLGMKMVDIAKKYSITPHIVRKELDFAHQNGLIESLEERILTELVPLAIDTYKHKMSEDKDAFVAKDVLQNLSRLSEKQEKRNQSSQGDTLEAYLKMRMVKSNDPTATTLVSTARDVKDLITSSITPESSEETSILDVAAHSPTPAESPDELSETTESGEDSTTS